MHALRSQLDNVEREVKQHSTILNEILNTLKSLEYSLHTDKSHTPASRYTPNSAVTPSSDLTSTFSASFMETPQTDGSIPSCGTNSSMETATPFAFLSSDVVFGAVGLRKKETTVETDAVQKPAGGVHFLDPIDLPLNDVLAEESESDGPFDKKDANPYKHIDTPVPTLSQRQKVASAASDVFSKIVSPTDTFNKSAAAAKQFPTVLSKPSSTLMSKQDRKALPPKRTALPVPQVKAPLRTAPAPAKSPSAATTDVLLHLPAQPAHLSRRAAGGNILDSHEVFRRKMTRKLQSESAEQLRKQFSSAQLHTLTPPDARTLHAVPFNASTNPKSTSSPTKPSTRTKTNSSASSPSRASKEVPAAEDTGKSFSYQDFSTPPVVTARAGPIPTAPATVPGATVPTRLPKRTSPEKSTAVKGPDRATTFHTPKVLRSRRDAPVSKSALLMTSLAGTNNGSSHSSPRRSVSARLEAANRRTTTAAATAAIASATTATNKIIAQLQAQNHGKVLRGGNKVEGSSDSQGKVDSSLSMEPAPTTDAAGPISPVNAAGAAPIARATPPKSPRRSPKNIQHSPVYTRHPDQWSTTRPLSAAKQALMAMQSPTAGATRRRSISGAGNRSSISTGNSAKSSPYSVSGEKSSGVVGSVDSPLPTPDYPPPAPPSTPTSAQYTGSHTNPTTMLTPIVANSPYTNYHLDSYSKYAHIMATPATPAPRTETERVTEEFLLNHPPPSTPDRDNWSSVGVTYPTAPSPRALPIPFPTSPSSRRSNIYTALHATPGAVEVEQSDNDSNDGSSDNTNSNSVDSIDGSPAARPAVPTPTALVEECYSPYSPSAIGASARYRFSSPTSAGDLNDTTIAQPSSTPMSATTTTTTDDSYTYTTPSTTIMNSICLDFSTPADFYTLGTVNSPEHTNFSTPMSGASDSSGTPTINPTTTTNDLFSSSFTRTNTIPNNRYGSINSTSRVTFAPEATELSCRTSSTTMQANPIGNRMPSTGLHRSMTIRTQINTIGNADERTGMAMMEPDTPLPAPSPYAAAVRVNTTTSIDDDASPFSPAAATTTATTATGTTILRQCSTYKGTPRFRSRSRSSASGTSESLDDAEDALLGSSGDAFGDGGDSGGVGVGLAISVTVGSHSESDNEGEDADLTAVAKDDNTHMQTAPAPAFADQLPEEEHNQEQEQEQMEEQEIREVEDYTALMESLIVDYFAAQDHPRDDSGDGSVSSDSGYNSATLGEQEGEATRNWSTAPSIGDITDLFDAFDGFSAGDSAYHAFLLMGEEVEDDEDDDREDRGDREEEGKNSEEKEGYMGKKPSLEEDIAAIVNNGGVDGDDRDSSDNIVSDSGGSGVNYVSGVGENDTTTSNSPGYGTMYAQLYTNGDGDDDVNTAETGDDGTALTTLQQSDSTENVATDTSSNVPMRGSYAAAAAVALSEMGNETADADVFIQYSPERPDTGRGRARSHARHSSGSFDDILGIIRQQKDTTITAEEDTRSDPVGASTASDPTTDAGTNSIMPATVDTTTNTGTTTADDANPGDDKDVDMCEKFGEGEGEGGEGWQGVVGRHSARKKKAHNKALQQEKQMEKEKQA